MVTAVVEGSGVRVDGMDRGGDGAVASSWTIQIQTLGLYCFLALPALTPAAALLKVGLPIALAGVCAWLLWRGDLRRYVALCAWAFALTPLVRRLIDQQAGWSDGNLVLTAPYACGAMSLAMIPHALTRPRDPASIGLLAIVAAAAFGLVLSATQGNLVAGVYDFLLWTVPPCLAVAVMANPSLGPVLARDLTASILATAVGVGIYAIHQYQDVLPWDASWMTNSQMNSIGSPLPYMVRVFGTMNAPGSFAFFLVVAILVALASRERLRWPALAIGSVALALTIVRSAWLGLGVGLVQVAMTAPARVRTSLLVLVAAGFVLAPVALVDERASSMITDRISSMSDLSADTSMRDRMTLYGALFDEMDRNFLGTGLGMAQSDRTDASGIRSMTIDGGPIEIILAVGLIGALVYYAGVAALVAQVFMRRLSETTSDPAFLSSARSIVVVGLLLQASGPTTVGPMGFYFWIVLGVAVATAGGRTSRN